MDLRGRCRRSLIWRGVMKDYEGPSRGGGRGRAMMGYCCSRYCRYRIFNEAIS